MIWTWRETSLVAQCMFDRFIVEKKARFFFFIFFFFLLCCSFVRFCYAKRMAMTSSAKYRPSSTPHKPLELSLSLRSFCSHDSHFIKNQGGKCMVFALLNFVQKMIVVYVMWPPNTFTHARRTLTYIYIFIHLKKKKSKQRKEHNCGGYR